MATDLTITLNLIGDNGSSLSQDESFRLENLAGINTSKSTAVTGKWSSSSAYLSDDYGGSYYVTKELLGQEKNWGLVVLGRGGNILDPFLPIGFFFDSEAEDPFMAIEGFEPQKLSAGGSRSGVGHLLRCPLDNTLWSFNFHWAVA